MFNPNVVVKNIVNQPTAQAVLALLARILMAYILLLLATASLQHIVQLLGIWKRWVFQVQCYH